MKIEKIIYWLPRVIIIVLICFMGLLSIDVFAMNGTILEKIGGFLMHNIGTIVLILLLAFTWKKEKIGGILFIFAGLFFMFFFRTYQRIDLFFLISFPPLLAGTLFLLHEYKDDDGPVISDK